MSTSTIKSKYWRCLMYPDSLYDESTQALIDSINKDDYIEEEGIILKGSKDIHLSSNWEKIVTIEGDLGLDTIISPLHDSDLKSDGTPVKPHRHVIRRYSNLVSFDRFKMDCDNIGFVTYPNAYQSKLSNFNQALLYLCHLSKRAIRENKHVYSPEDMLFFGEYGYEDYIKLIDSVELDKTDRRQLINDIYDWCKDNRCYSMCDLFEFSRDNKPEWNNFLCQSGSGGIIRELMMSLNYRYGKGGDF